MPHPLYPLWTMPFATSTTCWEDSSLFSSYLPATTLDFPNFMTQCPAVRMYLSFSMDPPHEWLYCVKGGIPHWTETWYGNSPRAAATPSVIRGSKGLAKQAVRQQMFVDIFVKNIFDTSLNLIWDLLKI